MAVTNTNKTFLEVTKKRLSNTSFLRLFNILQDSEEFMNIFRSYTLNEDVTSETVFYEMYEIDHNDWLDNISYKYYNTPYLWWVIALMNNINNPFEDLQPGYTLKILKTEHLYQLLSEIRNIGLL